MLELIGPIAITGTEVMNRISELRKRKSLSLRKLADILATDGQGPVHFTSLGKIERGEQPLNLEMMFRLSRALGVSLYEVVDPAVAPAPGRFPAVHLPKGAKGPDEGITLGYLDPTLFSPRSYLVSGELLDGITDAMPSLKDPENWFVLVDPEGTELEEGNYYLLMDEAGEHYIRVYRDGPPRFEPLASGKGLRALFFGKEPVWVLGRVGPSLQRISVANQHT